MRESPAGALKLLIEHDWPGNVRELENVIERAIVTSHNGTLVESDFTWLNHRGSAVPNWVVPDVPLAEMERRVIVAALERKEATSGMRPPPSESTAQRSTTSSNATRSSTEPS